jgi:hypothetical protein
LVADSIDQIERGHFPPHSGIRFPQNPCLSYGFLGLCLNDEATCRRATGASRRRP